MEWFLYDNDLRHERINPMNFLAPLLFAQNDCAKIDSVQNRQFFVLLGAQKLMVREFLKYNFRPELDGILQ